MDIKKEVNYYIEKMEKCSSMTDLLMVMSAWQSFCRGRQLSTEEQESVDRAYLKAEERLIANVKPSLW